MQSNFRPAPRRRCLRRDPTPCAVVAVFRTCLCAVPRCLSRLRREPRRRQALLQMAAAPGSSLPAPEHGRLDARLISSSRGGGSAAGPDGGGNCHCSGGEGWRGAVRLMDGVPVKSLGGVDGRHLSQRLPRRLCCSDDALAAPASRDTEAKAVLQARRARREPLP